MCAHSSMVEQLAFNQKISVRIRVGTPAYTTTRDRRVTRA